MLRCVHSYILAVSSLVACSPSTSAGMSSSHSSTDLSNTADAERPDRAKASRIERIALSSSSGCALTTDRRLRCWGRDVTNAEPEWHAGFRDLSDIIDIAMGQSHACAVRSDGSLLCWGSNHDGAYGKPDVDDGLFEPWSDIERVPLPEKARAVAVNWSSTCIITDKGGARCTGRTFLDEDEEPPPERWIPIANVTDAVELSMGSGHACAIERSGTVVCWGYDEDVRGPDPTPPPGVGEFPWSVQVATAQPIHGIRHPVDITSGNEFACVLTADGEILCWGRNDRFPIGDGEAVVARTPTRVLGVDDAIDIDAGQHHACAVRQSGQLTCWGANKYGQLGMGDSAWHDKPVTSSFIDRPVAVAAGGESTCAVDAAGRLSCWGQEVREPRRDPVGRIIARTVTDLRASHVFAFHQASCAVIDHGKTHCWGEFYGLGIGRDKVTQSRPEEVVLPLLDPKTLTALGPDDICALTVNHEVSCWSQYTGNAIQWFRHKDVAELAYGLSRMLCLRQFDSTVWCWGESRGHLGDGATTKSKKPIQVVGLRDAIDVAATSYYGCAVLKTGALWCWGAYDMRPRAHPSNPNGPKTWVKNAMATPVPGITDAVSVVGGVDGMCIVRRNGRARCWRTDDGEPGGVELPLDDIDELSLSVFDVCARTRAGRVTCWQLFGWGGDITSKALEGQRVEGASDIVELSAGFFHTCGRRADDAVLCWGSNSEGQLGVLPADVLLQPHEVLDMTE